MKKRHVALLLISFTLFLFSRCGNNERQDAEAHRTCECPLAEIPDESVRRDSSMVLTDHDPIDWSLGGTVSAQIKKIVALEISANANSEEKGYNVSTTNIVSRVKNDYPQLIDKAFDFKIKRALYCAYHAIICQDTSLTSEKLRELAVEKLAEFEVAITKELSKDRTTPRTHIDRPVRDDIKDKKIKQATEKTIFVTLIVGAEFSDAEIFANDIPVFPIKNTLLIKELEIQYEGTNTIQIVVKSSQAICKKTFTIPGNYFDKPTKIEVICTQ